jgi:phospholipid N-methyltransferase
MTSESPSTEADALHATADDAAPAPGDTSSFLTEIFHHPHQIGAIAPSGRHLAALAAGLIPTHLDPQVVVELGPGSGVITDALHARLPAGSTLLAVEVNTAMVTHLRRTRPWLRVIHGDAADLPALAEEAGVEAADLIISALPWTLLDAEKQSDILSAVAAALAPHGTFATVVTLPVRPLPRIRRLRRYLAQTFDSVTRTHTVWRNTPPASLYVCRSPRRLIVHARAGAAADAGHGSSMIWRPPR